MSSDAHRQIAALLDGNLTGTAAVPHNFPVLYANKADKCVT